MFILLRNSIITIFFGLIASIAVAATETEENPQSVK